MKRYFLLLCVILSVLLVLISCNSDDKIRTENELTNKIDTNEINQKKKFDIGLTSDSLLTQSGRVKFSKFLRDFNNNTDFLYFDLFWFHRKFVDLIEMDKLDLLFFDYSKYKGLNLKEFLIQLKKDYGEVNFIEILYSPVLGPLVDDQVIQSDCVIYYKSDENNIILIYVAFAYSCTQITSKKDAKNFNYEKLLQCDKLDFVAFKIDINEYLKDIYLTPFYYRTERIKKDLVKKIKKAYNMK